MIDPSDLSYEGMLTIPTIVKCNVCKFFNSATEHRTYLIIKRLLDILLALLLLMVVLPLFIIIVAAIKLDSKGNAFFKQDRVGKNGKIFKIYKFRTMVMQAPCDVATAKLKDSNKYITKMGRFLRKTSLDELPQLLNILKGEMSLIGPRPLVLSEKEIHRKRLEKGVYFLRPGLTGLAQINGRDLVLPDEKIKYDELYLKTLSFKLDFLIFIKSIYIVLKHKDVVEGDKLSSSRRCLIHRIQNNKKHNQ